MNMNIVDPSIQSTIVNRKDCSFLVPEKRSFDLNVIGGQSEGSCFSLFETSVTFVAMYVVDRRYVVAIQCVCPRISPLVLLLGNWIDNEHKYCC